MSTFLQNKQNLIMIGQFIIVAGVSFYFHKKLKAVVYNINELHKMILSQQEQINKQNAVIESLRMIVLSNSSRREEKREDFFIPQPQPVIEVKKSIKEREVPEVKVQKREVSENKFPESLINSTLIFKASSRPQLSSTKIEEIEEEEEEVTLQDIKATEETIEEDLDAELEKELNELNEDL